MCRRLPGIHCTCIRCNTHNHDNLAFDHQASFEPGQGTSEDDGQIFASVVGKVAITKAATASKVHTHHTPSSHNTHTQLPSISVQRTRTAQVPATGQLITARVRCLCTHAPSITARHPQVTRVTPRVAAVDILCIGTQPLHEPFNGVIR